MNTREIDLFLHKTPELCSTNTSTPLSCIPRRLTPTPTSRGGVSAQPTLDLRSLSRRRTIARPSQDASRCLRAAPRARVGARGRSAPAPVRRAGASVERPACRCDRCVGFRVLDESKLRLALSVEPLSEVEATQRAACPTVAQSSRRCPSLAMLHERRVKADATHRRGTSRRILGLLRPPARRSLPRRRARDGRDRLRAQRLHRRADERQAARRLRG